MITADRLIPKTYESDTIFAECEALAKELEAVPPHTTRASELRVHLYRRQQDYLKVHAVELDTLDTHAQVAEIAKEHGEVGLHDAILTNARARLAIGEARYAAIKGSL